MDTLVVIGFDYASPQSENKLITLVVIGTFWRSYKNESFTNKSVSIKSGQ